ncbi:MAG: hypothetical protein AAF039_12805 [Bacteroidota bacterium]
MNSLLEISVDLESVFIWNFYKVLETSDYSWINEDCKEKDWLRLYDEYYKEAGLKMPDWKTMQKHTRLTLKLYALESLVPILMKRDDNYEECQKTLRKFGYRINPSKPFLENIERFYRNMEVLGTKIKILEEELPKDNDQKLDLWSEVIRLKKHFKFDIDPKKTNCIEWLKLKKQYKEDAGSS